MRDHPLLLPTSGGPLGAVVTEPEGEPRAALMFMHGGAPSGRSGHNAIWARVARELSQLGVAVLRIDYPNQRESSVGQADGLDGAELLGWPRIRRDMALLREALSWFRERAGAPQAFVAGACYGGRLAIHLGAEDPSISGLLLIVPYVGRVRSRRERVRRALGLRAGYRDARTALDRAAVGDLARVLDRAAVTTLLGEKDPEDADALREAVGRTPQALELQVAPGIALHPVVTPAAQAEVLERMIGWASGALEGSRPAGTAGSAR